MSLQTEFNDTIEYALSGNVSWDNFMVCKKWKSSWNSSPSRFYCQFFTEFGVFSLVVHDFSLKSLMNLPKMLLLQFAKGARFLGKSSWQFYTQQDCWLRINRHHEAEKSIDNPELFSILTNCAKIPFCCNFGNLVQNSNKALAETLFTP